MTPASIAAIRVQILRPATTIGPAAPDDGLCQPISRLVDLVETMGIEPTTPCLQSGIAGVSAGAASCQLMPECVI